MSSKEKIIDKVGRLEDWLTSHFSTAVQGSWSHSLLVVLEVKIKLCRVQDEWLAKLMLEQWLPDLVNKTYSLLQRKV